MTKPRLQQALRVALSHCQKLRLVTAECDRARAAGDLSEAQHRTLVSNYHEQIHLAEASVAKVRTEIKREIARLGSAEKKVRARQHRLVQKAGRGRVSAKRANELNRKLLERADEFDAAIAEYQALAAARKADDVGGFVDLPLDSYRTKTPAVTPAVSPAARWVALIAMVLTAVMVFLPWFRLEDGSYPLFRLALLLDRQGVLPTLPAVLGFTLSLPFLLLPLAAVPFARRRQDRRSGWGILVVGILVLAAGVIPVTVIGAPRFDSATLTEIVQLFHWGSFGYCLGGLTLILLGARRVNPPGQPLAASVRGAVAVGTIVAAVGLPVAMLVLFAPRPFTIGLDGRIETTGEDRLVITCDNHGGEPVYVHVPWRDGRPAAAPGESVSRTIGLTLHVRERGTDMSRLLPRSDGYWQYRSGPVPESGVVTIEPGLSADLAITLDAVRELSPRAESFEVRITRADGKLIKTYEAGI